MSLITDDDVWNIVNLRDMSSTYDIKVSATQSIRVDLRTFKSIKSTEACECWSIFPSLAPEHEIVLLKSNGGEYRIKVDFNINIKAVTKRLQEAVNKWRTRSMYYE